METILSIIICAYNAEKTIRYCLDSLADHAQHAAEIIVVDDGSQDRTSEICRQYIQSGYRLRLLHQPNSGISAARNLALRHASGEYFTLVDADDFVCSDFCQILEQCLCSGEYDVLWFGTAHTRAYTPYKTGQASSVIPLTNEELAQLKSVPLYYDYQLNQPDSPLRGISPSTAWGSVFRRRLQSDNQVFFSKDVLMYEDGIFNLNMLHYCQKSGFLPLCMYQYMLNVESVTNRFRTDWKEKFSVRNSEAVRIIREAIGVSMEDTSSLYVQRYYASVVFQAMIILENQIFSANNPANIFEKYRMCRDLLRDPLYRVCLERCPDEIINPDEQRIWRYLVVNNALYTCLSQEARYWKHRIKLLIVSQRRKTHN